MEIETGKRLTEDEAIEAGWHKGWLKRRTRQKEEYRKKARMNNLPFCNSCFIRDYPSVKTWKHYTEMKPIKDHIAREKYRPDPKYGKIIGIHRDYECTHIFMDTVKIEGGGQRTFDRKCPGKLSVWIPIDELPEDYFKKSKASK